MQPLLLFSKLAKLFTGCIMRWSLNCTLEGKRADVVYSPRSPDTHHCEYRLIDAAAVDAFRYEIFFFFASLLSRSILNRQSNVTFIQLARVRSSPECFLFRLELGLFLPLVSISVALVLAICLRSLRGLQNRQKQIGFRKNLKTSRAGLRHKSLSFLVKLKKNQIIQFSQNLVGFYHESMVFVETD